MLASLQRTDTATAIVCRSDTGFNRPGRPASKIGESIVILPFAGSGIHGAGLRFPGKHHASRNWSLPAGLKPGTVKQYRNNVSIAVSALVHSGVPMEELSSLGEVFRPARLDRALGFQRKRADGRITDQMVLMALRALVIAAGAIFRRTTFSTWRTCPSMSASRCSMNVVPGAA